MFEDIFRRQKVIPGKLETYGFQEVLGTYRYDADVLNGEFHLEVSIGKNAVPDTRLMEAATGEEYVLYKTDAAGKYVGEIRTAVAAVLQDIADRCYELTIFKAEQSVKLIAYIREKYGDELE